MPEQLVIRIETPPALERRAAAGVRNYSGEIDDIRSLLHDLCGALDEAGEVRFVVEFAGERWPTDVRTDLSTVLEQLPVAARTLCNAFEVDFFEQGLERTLHFKGADDMVEVSCTSRHPTWSPLTPTIHVERKQLREALRRLVARFIAAATVMNPEAVNHPWFIDWKQAVSRI
jgi:hypothetical protein